MELLMVLCIGWILGPIDFAITAYKHLHTNKDETLKIDIDLTEDNIH